MELAGLVGNQALKKQLSSQADGRGLSHAYLITGPKGSGKTTLATLLAAAMVCTGRGERPCGFCPACKKALKGIHPDIITVTGEEEGKKITVAQARAVRADAYIRPNEADRKVYLFEDASLMELKTQNVFLKLLEEGPPYAAFLLQCENPGQVLETIRSRCEGLSLTPVTPEEARSYLLSRFPQLPPQQVTQAADACGGILGAAVDALEGKTDDGPVREAGERLMELLAARDELGLAQLAVSLEKWDRNALSSLCGHTLSLLRDALFLQAGTGPDHVPQGVREAAQLPRSTLLRCVELVEELRRSLPFNVGAGHLCGALAAGFAMLTTK